MRPRLGPPTQKDLDQRSVVEGECRIWTGKKIPKGYGLIARKRGDVKVYSLVHRVAYELAYGPIPAGREIHHTCERKACINAAHLQAVTRNEHKGTIHVLARDDRGRFLPL